MSLSPLCELAAAVKVHFQTVSALATRQTTGYDGYSHKGFKAAAVNVSWVD